MAFLVGVLPVMAQDEVEEIEVAAPVKKETPAKVQKSYPMIQVSGRVTDAATGMPLPGVQLRSYNNAYYTAMTDEDGRYTISVPEFVTSISAQVQGYNLVRTAINGRTENVDF